MTKESSPLSQLTEHLSRIEDIRMDRTKLYPLNEILFLCVSAVISGFEDWEEIVDFGEEKLEWLRKYLPYENGIPSHDTVNRVVSMLDYRVFEKSFIDWATMEIRLPNGTVISMDGKKLRGSATKKEQQTAHIDGGKSAKHIVHAWCGSLEMCLGQYQVAGKSNEIVAIPALLELLAIEGCIITIDAIGCQKKIVEKIVKEKADYVISVKDNQEALALGLFEAFNIDDKEVARPSEEQAKYMETERNHGRIEMRTCKVLPSSKLPDWVNRGDWSELNSIICVQSRREILSTGVIEEDERFYISSLMLSPKEFNTIVRAHWKVENQLHWTLDAIFGEDGSRKRIRNAAENFSTIRKIALNLLKNNSEKISVNRKRNKAALSDLYREKMLKI